jgi:hypothetical protein
MYARDWYTTPASTICVAALFFIALIVVDAC